MTPQDLVDLGFAVVAVAHPLPDGACSCRFGGECPAIGKHPTGGRGWMQTALRQRAKGYPHGLPYSARLIPETSYGLLPPPGSGLVTIDRDDPTVGLPMGPTYEVHRASADPRKGHYIFRLADDIEESEVPRTFSGGEIRVGGSGFTVGPGSRHVSGDLYVGNDAPVGIADRELIDALSALKPVRRSAEGAVDAVLGSRHAFLVGQARKLAGWGRDSERIEEELRTLNAEYCVPPLTEGEAEFGRMAQWAETNIAADRGPTITRRGTRATTRSSSRGTTRSSNRGASR
jgi:hypothetical protein